MGPAEPYLYPLPLTSPFSRVEAYPAESLLPDHERNHRDRHALFKRELESEKIWDVGNYVAGLFVGESDAYREPRGIDAAYIRSGR